MRVAVIGAGSGGTTIASMLAPKAETTLWARDPALARAIEEGENPHYLPGVNLPDELAATGPAEVIGRSYNDIVQDVVEALAWGQNGNGGWRYDPNYGSSDNSVSQWPVIGLAAAKRADEEQDLNWDPEFPDYILTNLDPWTHYIHIDMNGGTG